MHWGHHAAHGLRANPAANSNEPADHASRHDLAALGGWAKHQLQRVVNFAAPRSEDFLPVVLDHEKLQRAAWAKRNPGAPETNANRH